MTCADVARRFSRGFTLLELMVTLAIILIVLMFASGPFGALMAQSRLTTTVNDFVGTLTLARSTAVMGNGAVTVCSNNGDACGENTDWAKGALLLTGEEIRKRLDVPAQVRIQSNVKVITFNPDGSAEISDDKDARWVFCAESGDAHPRIVSVIESGANYLYKSDGYNCPL
jgi:type IV fimbrial biogenesis protein FimT